MIIRKLHNTSIWVDVWGNGVIESAEYKRGYHAYIAIDENGKLVGALTISRHRKNSPIVRSICTGVRPTWHHQGIASQLWKAMIKEEKPRKIIVTAVSDKGHTLIAAMRERFSRIQWKLDSCGHKDLRKQ